MSNTPSPVRPLNIGNVVSAGIVLYRSNLKQYFGIALRAHLWFLPLIFGFIAYSALVATNSSALILILFLLVAYFYCTAKYLANSALISRLAYQELSNQPESIGEASTKVLPHLWSFLGVAIGIGLRLILVYILVGIPTAIIMSLLLSGTGSASGPFLLTALVGIVVVLAVIWVFSRWVIAELPLAVETGLTASQSIKRSWDLTASSVGRVQAIVFVAFLVTIPIQAITGYLPNLLFNSVEPNTSAFWIVYLINLVISLIGGILVLPFWQSIKAVMYYDLRSRREGIDLQLRDR
jgi:Membrane domain of glycerophosphoryl diester phosphodiesterase